MWIMSPRNSGDNRYLYHGYRVGKGFSKMSLVGVTD
jgi:hypothetical protein